MAWRSYNFAQRSPPLFARRPEQIASKCRRWCTLYSPRLMLLTYYLCQNTIRHGEIDWCRVISPPFVQSVDRPEITCYVSSECA